MASHKIHVPVTTNQIHPTVVFHQSLDGFSLKKIWTPETHGFLPTSNICLIHNGES
jgi:hypothetical protein